MSDSEGTHYLIVPHDSEVLTGGTNPDGGFFHLAARRETLLAQVVDAFDQRTAHHETANDFRWGTFIAAVAWGACVIITEGLCLALGGAGAGFFGLSMNKDNDAEIQEILIEGKRTELDTLEGRMRGKFEIGQVIYGQR